MQSILNQIVYFGYFQSFFLIAIFLFSPKNRKNINGYVAFFVVVLMIGLTGRVLYISEIFGKNFRLISFSEFATLLFGTTVYLLTKSSLLGKRFSYKDLLHYVPAIFYNICMVFTFMIPSDEVIGVLSKDGVLFWIISIFVAFGLIFNIGYWVMSLKLFLKFKNELKNELSYSVKTQFFQNFLIAIGLCLLAWVVVFFISLMGYEMFERSSRQIIWLSISLIILFIAYYGMTAPQLFQISPLVNIQAKKYAQSKLAHSDLENLKIKLDQLMIEKKPYLNRKLLKAELAEMLGVSSPEIARLLNENIGMNFFEYVNYYRIKEFVELAKSEKGQNLTFFGLAQEAGFNSKTTFNKSFKKLMGVTPKEYFAQNLD